MPTNGSWKSALKLLFAASLIFVSSSAQAKEDAKLENIVRNSKVIKSAYPVTVERSGSEANAAIVTTLLDPKAKPNDCKIDAMLVARSLIEGDKSIEKVYYRLKREMSDSAFDSVMVRVSDVKAYGMKAIDEQTLLSELDVVHRGPKGAPAEPSAAGKVPDSATTHGSATTHVTATTGGSGTTFGTATTNGAPPMGALRQFIFRKVGDRNYGVSTSFGHRALSYAWLCEASDYLATVQKHGQRAPGSEAIFKQMENLSKKQSFGDAHRLGVGFQDALTKDTGTPNFARGADPVDYRQVNSHYYQLLQKELGKDTPPQGMYFIERAKPIIRLKELDSANVNTAPLYAIYRQASAAYQHRDMPTMTTKLVELTGILASKYPAH